MHITNQLYQEVFQWKEEIKKGNGEGSIFFSEKLNCYIAQYVEPSGKRKTLKQRKQEKVSEFKSRFNKIINDLNQNTYIEKVPKSFIEILK